MTLSELLRPVRGRLASALVLQALGSVAAVVPFVAVAELARALLGPAPDPERVWTIAAVGAGALVARFVLVIAAGGLTHIADNDLGLVLRRRMADRLGRVPLGWFTERTSGAVRKSISDDVSAMHTLVGHTLTDLTGAVVTPLVALGYLLWVDWRMALLTLVPALVGMGMYAGMMRGAKELYPAYDAAVGRIGSGVVEFVQGIPVVKTFGQAGRAHRRFVDAADDFAEFFLGWVRPMVRASAVMELILSPVFTLLWVLGMGTVFVTAGWLPGLDVLPFALLGLGLTAPLLTVGYAGEQIRTAAAAAGRVSELLATPELPQPVSPREPEGVEVVFDAVGYGYDERARALDGIDLALAPGTVTAVVGPSGSGKTTLARLLPRFFDPDAGAVRIGGVDLRELSADRLYRLVSFVFQDVRLLRASVRDNVALARPDATDAELRAAAAAARIADRIDALPRGWESVIGEDAQLSGGEAQRLSIARALLADTPILVLDEACAMVDPEAEAAIQDALSTLVAGRTLLVIAHRLSTITRADQIVVLQNGRVAQRGRHEELVGPDGWYARAWAAHQRADARSAQVSVEVTS